MILFEVNSINYHMQESHFHSDTQNILSYKNNLEFQPFYKENCFLPPCMYRNLYLKMPQTLQLWQMIQCGTITVLFRFSYCFSNYVCNIFKHKEFACSLLNERQSETSLVALNQLALVFKASALGRNTAQNSSVKDQSRQNLEIKTRGAPRLHHKASRHFVLVRVRSMVTHGKRGCCSS